MVYNKIVKLVQICLLAVPHHSYTDPSKTPRHFCSSFRFGPAGPPKQTHQQHQQHQQQQPYHSSSYQLDLKHSVGRLPASYLFINS